MKKQQTATGKKQLSLLGNKFGRFLVQFRFDSAGLSEK